MAVGGSGAALRGFLMRCVCLTQNVLTNAALAVTMATKKNTVR